MAASHKPAYPDSRGFAMYNNATLWAFITLTKEVAMPKKAADRPVPSRAWESMLPQEALLEGLRELTLAGSEVSLPDYASSVASLLAELTKAGWTIVPSFGGTPRAGISVHEAYGERTPPAPQEE
jgi:hypothetical protein